MQEPRAIPGKVDLHAEVFVVAIASSFLGCNSLGTYCDTKSRNTCQPSPSVRFVKTQANTEVAGPAGFLLLDADCNPIFVNPEALQILSYPRQLAVSDDLKAFLTARLQRRSPGRQGVEACTFAREIMSGRRLYSCRTYPVCSHLSSSSQPSFAILLERGSDNHVSLALLARRFHLTLREGEVMRHLLIGLTSKEIAAKMRISPNTVKAFLRLLMLKMGVSTRSGLVGKVLVFDTSVATREARLNLD